MGFWKYVLGTPRNYALTKRAQGKPYYVYMTAGANKFLRIYYGRVKEYLSSLPESE